MMLRRVSWSAWCAALFLSSGCIVVGGDSDDDATGAGGSSGRPQGVGPVARNASEAWPDEPSGVPVLDREQIAEACVRGVSCGGGDASMLLLAVDVCVNFTAGSAERAIPMRFGRAAERAEFWVDCVSQAPSCDAVAACQTGLPPHFDCEEAGCLNTALDVAVTCDGDVAAMVIDGRTFTRDCSRAFAFCDSESATGCTDRQFTSCPPDLPRSDRCDGDIRLGCDGANQVSYRDCRRLGGRCGTTSTGTQDCIYSDSPDPECSDAERGGARCNGGMLEVCVTDERVSVAAPELCP